jgi:putative ABC transport system permease protein
MVREFGMDDPVGKAVPGGKFKELEIIGVIEDFHYESLHREIKPMILATDSRIVLKDIHNFILDTDPAPDILVRIQGEKIDESLALINTIWEDVFPGEKFSYQFINEVLADQYRSENSLSKMIFASTLIAIITAMLGLFAITALTLTSRTKEIGIRKVLGATSFSITYLLTREFLAILTISFLISTPISYVLMKQWLLKFQFQTPIGLMLFGLVALIGLLFTLLTVSSQAFTASLKNPVDSIKEE